MRVRPQDVAYISHEWKNVIRAKRRAARKYQKEETRENTGLRRKATSEYWKTRSLSFNPSQASSKKKTWTQLT